MARNPYIPPTARLHAVAKKSDFLALTIALVAGILSWLAFGYALELADRFLLIPLIEAGLWRPAYTKLHAGTTDLLFATSGAALGALRASSPWILWCAFFLGILICLLTPVYLHGEGIGLAIFMVLHNWALWIAAVSSGAALFFVARRRSTRPNTSLERTRER
jgi:hypothetical protein